MPHVLGLAALGVALGEWLKRRLPILDRLNIPASVAGGGTRVLGFWALASAGAVLQGLLGVGLCRLFDLHPLLGVISGPGALAGGPATSLAFGALFEKLGARAATTVGLASATFGITVAGLLSGYIGGRLIGGAGLQPAAPQAELPAPQGPSPSTMRG